MVGHHRVGLSAGGQQTVGMATAWGCLSGGQAGEETAAVRVRTRERGDDGTACLALGEGDKMQLHFGQDCARAPPP